MKKKLIELLNARLASEIDPRNPVKFLKELDAEDSIDIAIGVLFTYTRKQRRGDARSGMLVEVISSIGHAIRSRHSMKRDSSLAAKSGAFVLWCFEAFGIIEVKLGRGKGKHAAYLVNVAEEDVLNALWETVKPGKTERLPSLVPHAPWSTTTHPCGARLIKTNNRDVLSITAETHPIVFHCVNSAQTVGWMVNEPVLKISEWAFRNKTDAFMDVWEMQRKDAKASKLREIQTILAMGRRMSGVVFYHLYNLDFRARKYPATAYLHEQGSDVSRGLLLRADKKALGSGGYTWLLLSIASNWAGDAGRADGQKTDKIPLADRIEWVLDNEDIILSYAESPKVSQGWMSADSPWQFIAACFELAKLRIWQMANKTAIADGTLDEFGYESHLEAYIDGSNNGSQHLAALTKDEVTAPHVNLVPMELPGDLYRYVADHVWLKIEEHVKQLSLTDYLHYEEIIDEMTNLKHQIQALPADCESRQGLIDALKGLREEQADNADDLAAVFWHKIRDAKHRRKVCKRNVMTLPYGGTAFGLGQQQIDDARKHGIDSLNTMEHRWGSFMGRAVFDDCRESLERPMKLLGLFEEAGKAAEERGEFLSWRVPITDFPVVQHYTEGAVRRVYVQYGPPTGERINGYFENTLQLHVCFIEDTHPSKGKQSQGAAPNAIHSLDAAHLMLLVYRAEFPVTTIHDSFGTLLADMPSLFVLTRETFVELHAADPLQHLLDQMGIDITRVDRGNLDITSVLDSAYCFV